MSDANLNLSENVLHGGWDNGYGFGKFVPANGNPDGELKIRSCVHKVGEEKIKRDRSQLSFVDNTGRYLVGDRAVDFGEPSQSSVDSSYIESNEYRVQALHAFSLAAGKKPNEDKRDDKLTRLRIVTGLPVEWYQKDAHKLMKIMKGWKNNKVFIESVSVVPQPIGTVYDMQVDWNGQQTLNLKEQKIGLIDVGHGTIDLIEIKDSEVNFGVAGGGAEGISRLYSDVYSKLKNHKRFKDSGRDKDEIPKIILDGGCKIEGEFESFEKIIDESKKRSCEAINTLINDLWGNKRKTLDKIIITGGGADALRDHFDDFIPSAQLLIPEDPSMSNARGFAKLSMSL